MMNSMSRIKASLLCICGVMPRLFFVCGLRCLLPPSKFAIVYSIISDFICSIHLFGMLVFRLPTTIGLTNWPEHFFASAHCVCIMLAQCCPISHDRELFISVPPIIRPKYSFSSLHNCINESYLASKQIVALLSLYMWTIGIDNGLQCHACHVFTLAPQYMLFYSMFSCLLSFYYSSTLFLYTFEL